MILNPSCRLCHVSVVRDLAGRAATLYPAQIHKGRKPALRSSSINRQLYCKRRKYRNHQDFRGSKLGIAEPFRGTNSILLYVIAAGPVIVFFASYLVNFLDRSVLPADATTVTSEELDTQGEATMPSSIAPGRPGNLTAEQEQKLRELWQALFRIFGKLDGSHADTVTDGNANITGMPTNRSSTSELGTGESKKHRSRLNPFSKRHKEHIDDGASSATSADTPTSTTKENESSSNEKHGLSQAFREALAQQSPAELREFFWSMVKHDDPDAILLRFLRARKWDVQAASVMLVSALRWRSAEMHVDDDILKNGEAGALVAKSNPDPKVRKEAEDFLQQLELGKSYLHGYDIEGRPMCFVRVRLHRQGEQSESSMERFTVYTLETARLLLRPPVDTATIIFDMTGFSMANMDYTPVKFIIKCFEANYPESLGAILVYRAPWIFQSIWTIIRGWLDPVVAGKVHFVKTINDLSAFIPPEHIPREFDGNEDYTYSYIQPRTEENADMQDLDSYKQIYSQRQDLIASYEAATTKWIGTDHASSIAELEREELQVRRRDFESQLKANYWCLDPYIRARTLYDRLGILQSKGVLQFYHPETTD